MTILVAQTTGTESWIGSDSLVGTPEHVTELIEPLGKIVLFSYPGNDLAIGVSGNLSVFNELKYNDDIAECIRDHAAGGSLDKKSIKLIDDYIHEVLESIYGTDVEYNNLYATRHFVAESSHNRDIMFGHAMAAGTGYQYALGAMSVYKGNGAISTRLGIEAAIRFSPNCGGRVHILNISHNTNT